MSAIRSNISFLLTVVAAIVTLTLGLAPNSIVGRDLSLIQRVAFLEMSLILGLVISVQWTKSTIQDPERHYSLVKIIRALSVFLIGVALYTGRLTSEYQRPDVFFFTIAAYFILMFAELWLFPPNPALFVARLLIGSVTAAGTFAALYPGFVGADPYTFLSIANSIRGLGGGLPVPLAASVWYVNSPIESIASVVTSFTTSLPLVSSILLLGIVCCSLMTVCAAALALRIFQNNRVAMLASWFTALFPFLWLWATWPIPELIAVCALTILFLIAFGNVPHQIALSLPLIAIITLAHGGVSLETSVLFGIIYILSRRTLFLRIALISGLAFMSYATLVAESSASSGVLAIFNTIILLLTPTAQSATGSAVTAGGLLGYAEALSYTLPLAISVGLSWHGYIHITRRGKSLQLWSRVLILSIAVILVSYSLTISNSTSTDATRYLDLFAYSLLGVGAAFGIDLVRSKGHLGKVIVAVLCLLYATSGVSNGFVAPDLWQGLGDTHFATETRLQDSTTVTEFASMTYIESHDVSLVFEYNIHPRFLTLPNFSSFRNPGLDEYYNTILYSSSPSFSQIAPYLVLLSSRANMLGFRTNVVGAFSVGPNADTVYSNPVSAVYLVTVS